MLGSWSSVSQHRAAVKLSTAPSLPGRGPVRMDSVLGAWGGRKPDVACIESSGSGGEGGSQLASGHNKEEGNEIQVVALGLKCFHVESQGAGYGVAQRRAALLQREASGVVNSSETSPEHPSVGLDDASALLGSCQRSRESVRQGCDISY